MTEHTERRKYDIHILTQVKDIKDLLDVNERVRKLEIQVNGVLLYIEHDKEKTEKLFEDHKVLIEKLDKILFGANGNNGLFTDVDRLKVDYRTRETRLNWILGIFGAVLAAALITFFKIR